MTTPTIKIGKSDPWWVMLWASVTFWWFNGSTSPYVWFNPLEVAGPTTFFTMTGNYESPLREGIWLRRTSTRHKLIIGLDEIGDVVFAPEQTPVFVMGPPGSRKSVSIMAINALLAPGGALVVSPKPDLYMATAKLRAEVGRVWVMGPAKEEDYPGAFIALWSFIPYCTDYQTALKWAIRVASWVPRDEYSRLRAGQDHSFFTKATIPLMATMFLFARLVEGKNLAYFYNQVLRTGAIEPMVAHLRKTIKTHPDAEMLEDALKNFDSVINNAGGDERGSTMTSTVQGLDFLSDPDLLHMLDHPNFDIDELTENDATLYVLNAHEKSPVSKIIGLLDYAIRDACKERYEDLEKAGKPRPVPVTFVIDEASKSPLIDLMSFLSTARTSGISLAVGLQSLAQAVDLYGPQGEDMTNMGVVVVNRGIRHVPTLRNLEMLAGQYYETVHGTNDSQSSSGISHGDSWTQQRVPVIEGSQIGSGHPHWPTAALVLGASNGYEWLGQDGFFQWPWAWFIIASLERLTTYNMLPLPPMARYDDFRYLDQINMSDRWRVLVKREEQK